MGGGGGLVVSRPTQNFYGILQVGRPPHLLDSASAFDALAYTYNFYFSQTQSAKDAVLTHTIRVDAHSYYFTFSASSAVLPPGRFAIPPPQNRRG